MSITSLTAARPIHVARSVQAQAPATDTKAPLASKPNAQQAAINAAEKTGTWIGLAVGGTAGVLGAAAISAFSGGGLNMLMLFPLITGTGLGLLGGARVGRTVGEVANGQFKAPISTKDGQTTLNLPKAGTVVGGAIGAGVGYLAAGTMVLLTGLHPVLRWGLTIAAPIAITLGGAEAGYRLQNWITGKK